MRNILDWKFVVMLVATVAGIIVPIYLWRADIDAHALKFRLVSQTLLQPKEATGVPGLKVTVDNMELKSPYVLVVELVNSGEKPIAATDFEAPLELNIDTDSTLLRAQVTETSPKDLRVSLKFDKKSLQIQPLLLNPNDKIAIAVIVDGASPKLSPRARISGVPTVQLEDASKPASSGLRDTIFLLVSFLLFLSSSICSDGVFAKGGVLLRRPGAILVSFLTLFSGSAVLYWVLDARGHEGFGYIVASLSVMNLLSVIASVALGWGEKIREPSSKSNAT